MCMPLHSHRLRYGDCLSNQEDRARGFKTNQRCVSVLQGGLETLALNETPGNVASTPEELRNIQFGMTPELVHPYKNKYH